MGKKRILEEEEVAAAEVEDEHQEEEVVKDKKQKKSKSDKKSKKKEVVAEEEGVEVKEEEVEETEEKSSKKKKKEKNEETAATTASDNNKKSTKPLPPGYVCNACGMKDDHAIYNCPSKVSKKEKSGGEGQPAAKKAKTESSANNKPNLTVFLSGLPFDMTKPKLLDLIVDLDDKGTAIQQKDLFIVHFEDNPNRCRGLAYVNCPTKEEFERTLKLNGQKVGRMNITAVESSPEQNKKREGAGKKEKGESRCYRCGGTHDPKTCTNPRICYRCKGTDHLSKDCPKKKQ